MPLEQFIDRKFSEKSRRAQLQKVQENWDDVASWVEENF